VDTVFFPLSLSLSLIKSSQGLKKTIYLHLVLRLIMGIAIPLFLLQIVTGLELNI
jgi:hypothetical protein